MKVSVVHACWALLVAGGHATHATIHPDASATDQQLDDVLEHLIAEKPVGLVTAARRPGHVTALTTWMRAVTPGDTWPGRADDYNGMRRYYLLTDGPRQFAVNAAWELPVWVIEQVTGVQRS